MQERNAEIDAFLAANGWNGAQRRFLAGDASFRHYERVEMADRRAVLMDAPPEKEPVAPFLAVARYLAQQSYSAPRILAHSGNQGLLLLEDLGDDSYSRVVRSHPEKEPELYMAAAEMLAELHKTDSCHCASAAIRYGKAAGGSGTSNGLVCSGNYRPAASGGCAGRIPSRWRQLLEDMPYLPSTLVLRDFHADNLMWLPDRKGNQRVGLLDFQDAVLGSPVYDLVSLLEDARRDVSAETAQMSLNHYLHQRVGARRLHGQLRHSRRAAQLQDHRHFHAPSAAGWQAALSGVNSARVAKPASRPAASGAETFRAVVRNDSAARLAAGTCFAEGRVMAQPLHAMVLAAGLGTRMRSHRADLPKPLVPVGGGPLIDFPLALLEHAGLRNVVVNLHYMGEAIATYLAQKKQLQLHLSWEEERLETGGGICRALPLLGESFYVLNSDVMCVDSTPPALLRMARAWEAAACDALLLLVPRVEAVGYEGSGDFDLADDGALLLRRHDTANYVYSGIALFHRRFFDEAPSGAFSLGSWLRQKLGQEPGQVHGLVHSGKWFHIGDAGGVEEAERFLQTLQQV